MLKPALLFLLISLTISVNAQEIIIDGPFGTYSKLSKKEQEVLWRKQQKYTAERMGVSVQIPPGFSEISSLHFPSPPHSSSSDYIFVNKDSTVLVVIALMKRDSLSYEKDAARAKRMVNWYGADYDPDGLWHDNYKGTVDSSSVKPLFYTESQLKAYNADQGVEFIGRYRDLYIGKYQIARNITLNKKYRGVIEIQYFTLPNAKNNIKQEVQMGAKMISFKHK